MAQEYLKEDLENNHKLYANRLRTRVLEHFYTDNLVSQTYIYILENGEIIHLIFDEDQFCHLLGFSYFGYHGISGWNSLEKRNILLSNLQDISNHKREEIRIINFPKIIRILEEPTMYLYKKEDMGYKADYFAVWNDGKRYDNKEIDSDNLINVKKKFIMPKETFRELYYPLYITSKRLNAKLVELQKKSQ